MRCRRSNSWLTAFAANKSISKEKKEEIIRKLLSLLSSHQAQKIESLLHFEDNASLVSEQLYYTIDKISDAISGNRKISFCYCDPAVSGEQRGGGPHYHHACCCKEQQ